MHGHLVMLPGPLVLNSETFSNPKKKKVHALGIEYMSVQTAI